MSSISEQFSLNKAKDGSRAVILLKEGEFCPNGVVSDQLIQFIQNQGIIHGLKIDNIEKYLSDSQKWPKEGVVIAQVRNGWVKLNGCGEISSRSELSQKIQEKRNFSIHKLIDQDYCHGKTFGYIGKNEWVVTVRHADERNIFGKKNALFQPDKILTLSNAFDARGDDLEIEYLASKSGYLSINMNGELDIFPIERISEDRMKRILRLAPVQGDHAQIKEELKKVYLKFHQDEQNFHNLFKESQEGRIVDIVLEEGVLPKPGRDANIEYLFNTSSNNLEDLEKVDYRSKTLFFEVKANQLLARKSLAIPNEPGQLVDGTLIPCKSKDPEDIKLSFDSTIKAVENTEEKCIDYLSENKGICYLLGNHLYLKKDLIVEGDVGVETGHLNYSQNITVQGDVKQGTRIVCGGDLIIKGMVEDYSVIECKGDLTISGGVNGSHILINGESNININYVQNASIEAKGHIIIQKYALNAKIFSRKTITIEGDEQQGMSQDRGVVAGGVLNALEKMSFPSVGSLTSKTNLIVGVDQKIKESLETAKKLKFILTKKVSELQQELGVKIQKMNPKDLENAMKKLGKEKVKEILTMIKKKVEELDKIKYLIDDLQKNAYFERPELCCIEIQKHIVPDIQVQIVDTQKQIRQKMKKVLLGMRNGKVVEV